MNRTIPVVFRAGLRLLPATGAAALLLFALPAARGARAPAPAPDAMVYSGCSMPIQQGAISRVVWLPPLYGGVTQVVPGLANAAACSLTITLPCYSYASMSWVQWDPALLAPDPTTVALRTRDFDLSALIYGSARIDFVPPVVMKRLPGVADAPGSTMAMDMQLTGYVYNGLQVFYADSGDASIPAALAYAATGPRYALPGPHPVLSHAICGGDATLQKLYVVQSVMTCSAVIDTTSYDVVQRFRVPTECQLRWFEVASGPGWGRYGWPGGQMGILDAAGDAGAPASFASPLVSAGFAPAGTPVWTSHFDFDHIITLEPGHDYWLWVRGNHGIGLNVKQLTGAEGTAFTSNIGPLYVRYDSTTAFTAVPGKALDFRLIGVPLGMVGVAPASPAPSPLRLHVEPNPARGAALVRWSGAQGQVRFEVLDARGRRVGTGEGTSSEAGGWLWTATRPEGGPLPAGVYFVRARDGAGRAATERVVIVR